MQILWKHREKLLVEQKKTTTQLLSIKRKVLQYTSIALYTRVYGHFTETMETHISLYQNLL